MANFDVAAVEPLASRWRRRARTIPLMLAVTVVAMLASPAILVAAAIVDLTKCRVRLPTVRVPGIVLCRHVNVVDASLPTMLYQRLGYRTPGVIMAELLFDPGFDLVSARIGSVFIPRDDGAGAIAMVRRLGQRVDSTTAVVIFPEGRLARPDRLERAKARLAVTNPERAARRLDEQWLLVDRWITRQPVNDPERAELRRRREWCRGAGPQR